MSPDDILADLPDPREDEPAALRNDIAEELADHLICGVRREMVKGHDEPTPWKRTLERFGDPRQIARKLWWQAMRSKIMAQRIILGFQAAIFVGMFVMAGIMVSLASSQQRQLAEQTELIQEALAQLAAASSPKEPSPTAPPRDSILSHVQVKVVDTTLDGPVCRVARVALWKPPSNELISTPLVNEDGSMDFGYLEPGLYNVSTEVSGRGKRERQMIVHPGQDHFETVVIPISCKVVISTDLPAAMRSADVTLETMLHRVSTNSQPFGQGRQTIDSAPGAGVANDPLDTPPVPVRLADLSGRTLSSTVLLLPGHYTIRDATLSLKTSEGQLISPEPLRKKLVDFEIKEHNGLCMVNLTLPNDFLEKVVNEMQPMPESAASGQAPPAQ